MLPETEIDLFADLYDPPESKAEPLYRADDMVTAAMLADWLGLTSGRINELARAGILARQFDGFGHRFPLRLSIQAYALNLRASATARSQANPELAAAKLALTEANAVKVGIWNQRARAELIPAGEVRAVWAGIAADLRSRLLALPKRMALDRAATARIDRELRAALEDLADGAALTASYMAKPPDSGAVAGDSLISGVALTENETAPVGGPHAV